MTLTEFLLARIAEDEALARAATAPPWVPGVKRKGEPGRWNGIEAWSVLADRTAFAIEDHETVADSQSPADVDHIARHDPARVLAECAAKRQIIEFHKRWPVLVQTPPKFDMASSDDPSRIVCRVSHQIAWTTQQEYRDRFGDEPPTAPMLAAMAEVYADHPDYREEWRV